MSNVHSEKALVRDTMLYLSMALSEFSSMTTMHVPAVNLPTATATSAARLLVLPVLLLRTA